MENSSTAVSVVMPLYNKEHDVERAINSVLAQTFEDFELIVINDGSTDSGPDKVRTYRDRRIIIIDQRNNGVSAARNRGIEAASGNLIAFLDADDEWERDYLETILYLKAKYPACEVFATSYCICNHAYRRQAIIRGLHAGFKEGILGDYFNIAAQSDPPLWSSAVTVTKRSILSIDGFPPGITSGEDLLTWARLSVKYGIAYISQSKACFWAPSTADCVCRVPQNPDVVADKLMQLFREADPDRIKGSDKYLAHWYKMRANMYIRLGENAYARYELRKAMRHSKNYRLYFYYLISLLPRSSAGFIMRIMKKIYYFLIIKRPFSDQVHSNLGRDASGNGCERKDSLNFYKNIDRKRIYTIEEEKVNHPFYSILRRFIDKWDLHDKKCVEIGSSKGLFQDIVHDYTGVDVVDNLAGYYHKKYVVVLDEHLPFPSGSFDAVFSYTTHEHIPEIETALEEIVRVLKPGGICLFAPAWHTRPWFSGGYQVRSYKELSIMGKMVKILIPLCDSIFVRWPVVLCRRVLRLIVFLVTDGGRPRRLKYKRLAANYEVYWQSDCDACNSLDPFDVILWFRSRRFICHGYENLFKALFVRTLALELQRAV